jgi:putative inorganic carbon (HCO3(-)) transporter
MRPGTYLPFLEAAKLNTIIPLSVFVLTFISSGGPSNSHILKAKNTLWFGFFLCLFPIQIFTADVRLYVFDTFKVVLGYLLIYFVIIKQVNTMGRIKGLFATLIAVHIGLVILNPSLVLQPEQRNYIMGVTFLGDGNDFAWSVCIVVPFAIFLTQTSAGKAAKVMWLASTCLLIIAIVGSQSRGGSIALGAVLFYFFLKGKKKVVGLIGFAVVAMVVMVFAPQAYFDRISSIRDYETEGSAQGRIMAWKSAMRMAADNPFLGVGAGHFSVKYGIEYRPPGVGRTEIPWSTAHSIYFLVLGEYGFTGIVILLGLIISNLFRNRRRIKDLDTVNLSESKIEWNLAVTIQASLIGFAVGGAFLSGITYPHLYILIALMESVNLITSGRFLDGKMVQRAV